MRPLVKYLLTNSAVERQATQSIKSVSFSPPSLDLKSRSQARVKLHTLVPLWVLRSSGSRTIRPMMTMWFNILCILLQNFVYCSAASCSRGV